MEEGTFPLGFLQESTSVLAPRSAGELHPHFWDFCSKDEPVVALRVHNRPGLTKHSTQNPGFLWIHQRLEVFPVGSGRCQEEFRTHSWAWGVFEAQTSARCCKCQSRFVFPDFSRIWSGRTRGKCLEREELSSVGRTGRAWHR